MIETYNGYNISNPNQLMTNEEMVQIITDARKIADTRFTDEIDIPREYQDAAQLAQAHANKDYAQQMGIPPNVSSRIIYLLGKDYASLGRPLGSAAHFNAIPQSICVSFDQANISPYFFYQLLLHEEIHRRGRIVYQAVIDEGIPKVIAGQSGYFIQDGVRDFGQYRIFNEVVTEFKKGTIIRRNANEIKSVFKLNQDELMKQEHISYASYLKSVAEILFTCRQQAPDLNAKVLRGIYSGERDHLQIVNQLFGPRSLDILALLGKNKQDQAKPDTTRFDLYFSKDTPAEIRLKLRVELLAA